MNGKLGTWVDDNKITTDNLSLINHRQCKNNTVESSRGMEKLTILISISLKWCRQVAVAGNVSSFVNYAGYFRHNDSIQVSVIHDRSWLQFAASSWNNSVTYLIIEIRATVGGAMLIWRKASVTRKVRIEIGAPNRDEHRPWWSSRIGEWWRRQRQKCGRVCVSESKDQTCPDKIAPECAKHRRAHR